MTDFIAIDFETANERWSSPCSIGIAWVKAGEITHSETHLIKPLEMEFSAFNIHLHGITPQMVENAPEFPDLWEQLQSRFEGHVFVAHNAKFDFGVIRHTCNAYQMEIPTLNYYCSLAASKVVWPNAVSHSLGLLCTELGIELNHHDAESDARASAQIMTTACELSSSASIPEFYDSADLHAGKLFANGEYHSCSSGASKTRKSIDHFFCAIPEDYDLSKHPFHGKNIVITGDLGFCSRKQAHQLIEFFGGHPKTGVTKTTEILVAGSQDLKRLRTGESLSSKMLKALEHRAKGHEIQIISAKDFNATLSEVFSASQ